MEREKFSRLTFDAAFDWIPLWTPDARRVIFTSDRDGRAQNLYWKAADGTGQVERLTTSENTQYAHSSSPDGKMLAICGPNPGTNFDLGVLSMEGERTATPLLETEFSEVVPVISPDGHWMAYVFDDGESSEIYVRPFPDVEGGKWQISSGGGRTAVWGPDGRELFYRSGEAMMVVSIETEPTFVPGSPELLFADRYYADTGHYFDISRDGQRFLMMKEVEQTRETPAQLIVVENWFEELKRLVPKEN